MIPVELNFSIITQLFTGSLFFSWNLWIILEPEIVPGVNFNFPILVLIFCFLFHLTDHQTTQSIKSCFSQERNYSRHKISGLGLQPLHIRSVTQTKFWAPQRPQWPFWHMSQPQGTSPAILWGSQLQFRLLECHPHTKKTQTPFPHKKWPPQP